MKVTSRALPTDGFRCSIYDDDDGGFILIENVHDARTIIDGSLDQIAAYHKRRTFNLDEKPTEENKPWLDRSTPTSSAPAPY